MLRSLRPDLSQEHTISINQINHDALKSLFNEKRTPRELAPMFAEHFGHALIAFLTTENRLQIVRQGSSQSNPREAASLLQMLYRSGSDAERYVRSVAKMAFGKEVALDFTVPQRLLLRVGEDFSAIPPDPRDALPRMSEYEYLDDQGDGIRSFVGIAIALLVLNRGLFLIDEPEAFLHPPQAFRMGTLIAEQVNNSRQFIIATHSVDVLKGILSRTSDVNIVRVDRAKNVNLFNHLDADRLTRIINDPLLTSSRVLDGLFYSGAVVVEADSDARFYQAASMRRTKRLDLHFVNADNKQTVSRIVRLYRDMGVRAAGIVDFDLLNDRTDFEKSLRDLGLSTDEAQTLLDIQRKIGEAAKASPAEERLNAIRTQVTKISATLDASEKHQFPSIAEEQKEKNELLRQLESRFRELAEATKAWKILKRDGRAALSQELQADFDRLQTICAC